MLPIPIVIVSFRNPDDVVECLESLRKSNPDPAFDLYVCENGGGQAFTALCKRLSTPGSPCVPSKTPAPCRTDAFHLVASYALRDADARVFVGDPGANLCYGGGVNRWLRPLLEAGDWLGALILNPDTTVDPNALAELVRYAKGHRKGMVTGRIIRAGDPTRIHTRGLRWRPWIATPAAVGFGEPADWRPPLERLERELDAPSGSFVYVTHECLEAIGLMEERYFLYMEDLEWGLRAKRSNNIGYAFDSVIHHKGGTTIGTGTVKTVSPFATYLGYRNRMLYVCSHRPAWAVWSAFISVARGIEFGLRGRSGNMRAALRGAFDGIRGREGLPPEDVFDRHLNGERH